MLKINLITENLLFEITYFDSLKNKPLDSQVLMKLK